MAQREGGKPEFEDRARRRGKASQAPSKRLEAVDPESKATGESPSVDSPGVFSDARFSHPANIGHKIQVASQLQHSHGNAYVQRLLDPRAVQAKLVVNPPDDQYEREADRVADAVARPPDAHIQRQAEPEEEEMLQAKPASASPHLTLQRQDEEEEEEMLQTKLATASPQLTLQRQEEEEMLQTKPASTSPQLTLQRQDDDKEEEEEELLQAKPAGTQVSPMSEALEARIAAARGGGQPLDGSLRASIEPRFGLELDDVRVHTNAEADRLSRDLNARAFTTGKDVFFRQGDYQPGSPEGTRLLAHELTHVAQQNPSMGPRPPGPQRGGSRMPKTSKEQQSDETARATTAPSAGYVSRYLTEEERRHVERRTGPLTTRAAGPPQATVSETHRVALEGLLRTCFNAHNDAANDAITDFVRDHDREANYRSLASAIIAAPLGILGAALSGPATITIAVASAAVSVISSVPEAPSPMTAFRERMRDAFARVNENRLNSVDAIVSNYLMGVPPETASDLGRMRLNLVSRCFPGALHTGEAVNATEVRRVITRQLSREWNVIEQRRRAAHARELRRLAESGTFGYRTQ